MTYEFSLSSFFIGLLILIVGAAFVKWHRNIADNLGSGVSSYERFKLWAFIACGLGLIVIVNLHSFIINWLVDLIFPSL
jgi:hypothetical protein